MVGDDREAVRGGEVWARAPSPELDRRFPTLFASGELSLPIKGREIIDTASIRVGYFRLIRMAG
jgi:hypothetical protein